MDGRTGFKSPKRNGVASAQARCSLARSPALSFINYLPGQTDCLPSLPPSLPRTRAPLLPRQGRRARTLSAEQHERLSEYVSFPSVLGPPPRGTQYQASPNIARGPALYSYANILSVSMPSSDSSWGRGNSGQERTRCSQDVNVPERREESCCLMEMANRERVYGATSCGGDILLF